MHAGHPSRLSGLLLVALAWSTPGWAWASGVVVNDVTQLNPITVGELITPHSVEEIQATVRSHSGPISIGGGRFSQGGQIATEGALFIDMRQFDRVLALSLEARTISVQAGITWRKVQETIDPHNLSVKIMQTYANFTVGGSLSVNGHGRYVGQGPLVNSVRSIDVVLADGSLVHCSPSVRPDVFYSAIGGYGGIGVIVEATLDLVENSKVERRTSRVAVGDYKKFFFGHIRNDPAAVLSNGDLYPPEFTTVESVTWYRTDKPLTVTNRLTPADDAYWWEPRIINWVASVPLGPQLREYIIDPVIYLKEIVAWRNHEASYDLRELEPPSRKEHTFVLQEYFVPVENIDQLVPRMAAVLRKHGVNVVNVSIREAPPDPGTMLAWARDEVFAFVIYYRQGVTNADRVEVGDWTREMIDAVLSVNGTYYLPYQLQATVEQFYRAYPRAHEYFDTKAKLDPTFKFRNKLLDKYAPYPTAVRN